MPYNTRRKSLSLSELGIIIPKRARSNAHTVTSLETTADTDGPPVKRPKRSHTDPTTPPPSTSMSPPRTTNIHIKEERILVPGELSPPPSPPCEATNKVDLEGINDDIVIATIQQLQSTGNRPVFVRELGTILAYTLACVEKSANPIALISSRLTQYLGRSWPAVSPCPLAKDLSTVHPRRLYFYLTTMPKQPVPDFVHPVPKPKRIITPSISSASIIGGDEGDDDEEQIQRRPRSVLSPSPEVDLSTPELDDVSCQPTLPGRPFSEQRSTTGPPPAPSSLASCRRAASPQLEKEERDFKQTANALYEQAQLRRKRSQSQDVVMETQDSISDTVQNTHNVTISIESEDVTGDATTLFGHIKSPSHAHVGFSSPLVRPLQDGTSHAILLRYPDIPKQNTHHSTTSLPTSHKNAESMDLDMNYGSPNDVFFEAGFASDILQSPENVELHELDDMFEAY